MTTFRQDIEKGLFEVMAEVAVREEDYKDASLYYLQAAKEATTDKETERLMALNKEYAEKHFILTSLEEN